jgi:putative peptidoglycan lipid II flippase
LNPAFYALSDAKTPMWISLFSVVLNFGMAELLLLKFHMGISGLALSTSLAALVTGALLFVVLRQRLGGLDGGYLIDRVWRICLACVAMGLPVWWLSSYIAVHLGTSKKADLINLAICIPVGVVFFAAAAALLRIEETGRIWNGLRAGVKKRLSI